MASEITINNRVLKDYYTMKNEVDRMKKELEKMRVNIIQTYLDDTKPSETLTSEEYVLSKSTRISAHRYNKEKLNKHCNNEGLSVNDFLTSIVDVDKVKNGIKNGDLPITILNIIDDGLPSTVVKVSKKKGIQ